MQESGSIIKLEEMDKAKKKYDTVQLAKWSPLETSGKMRLFKGQISTLKLMAKVQLKSLWAKTSPKQ